MKHRLKVGVIGNDENTKLKFHSLKAHKQIDLDFLIPWSDKNILSSKDVIITTMEWSPKWRITIDECNDLNIPTFYLVDGIIDWDYLWNNWSYIKKDGTLFQPLLSNRIGVISNQQARLLSSFGLMNNIDIVGIPRLDEYKRKFKILSSNNILITTANTPYLNSYSEAYVKRAIKDLFLFFSKYKTYKPIWKIDPSIAEKLGINNNDDKEIKDLLNIVSATISFPSTVILESMIANIPTALIDYRNVPCLINTSWKITKESDIKSTIEKLLNPNKEFIHYQDFCLSDNLAYGNSTNRLVYNLFKLCNKEKYMENYDLKPLNISNDFNICELNNHITTFKIDNKNILQYNLDAYKKEANHLRGIIKYIIKLIESNKIKNRKQFFNIFKFKRIINSIESFIKKNL